MKLFFSVSTQDCRNSVDRRSVLFTSHNLRFSKILKNLTLAQNLQGDQICARRIHRNVQKMENCDFEKPNLAYFVKESEQNLNHITLSNQRVHDGICTIKSLTVARLWLENTLKIPHFDVKR